MDGDSQFELGIRCALRIAKREHERHEYHQRINQAQGCFGIILALESFLNDRKE